MEFKDKLKELRINANLKQEDVAARLFVSRTLVSKWEAGARYPSKDNLERLADLFQVSPSELIGEEKEQETLNGRKRVRISLSSAGGSRIFYILTLNRADIFALVKAILSVGLIPLWFVELFMGCSESDGMAAIFSFSMYDHTKDVGCSLMAYVSIGLLLGSTVMAVCSFIQRDRTDIRRASHIFSGVAVGLFIGFLIWAAAVGHGSAIF